MDLIKRADAIKAVSTPFDRKYWQYTARSIRDTVKALKDIPSAEPKRLEIAPEDLERLQGLGYAVESKQGEWIPYEAPLNFGDGEYYVTEHKCSACGYLWGEPDYKYCPECGARMKGADNE